MAEQIITYTIYIRSDVQAVWNALTNPDITQRYWFNTRIESDWRPGSKILYRRDGKVTDEHVISEIIPPRKLVHTFKPLFGEFAGELPSRVNIELKASGAVVRLSLRHDRFQPDSKVFPACAIGWPMILNNLKTLLETGEPLPDFDFQG
jgi:uncharacterized protein YndB with AHSA1/START domain